MKTKLTFWILLVFALTSMGFGQARAGGLIPPTSHKGKINVKISGARLQKVSSIGDPTNIGSALLAGANYIKQTQSSTDGGWDWVLTAPTFTHSGSASEKNLYGVCALGLYYAYLRSNDATYMTAMQNAADVMIADIEVRDASALKFLLLYNDLSGVIGTAYKDAAREKYDAQLLAHGETAATFAEYVRDNRGITQGYHNGIIGWDLGAWAVAVKMLYDRFSGLYLTDAVAIADVAYNASFTTNANYFDLVRCAGWDGTYANSDYWWYNLGVSGLIDAFQASNTYTSEIPGLITKLQNSTTSSGAVCGSYGVHANDEDWQSTAYAVMSLANLNPSTYMNEINYATYYLAATQDVSGGWLYSDGTHYPEVGGENTNAIYFGRNASTIWVDDDYTSTSYGGHLWGYDAFSNIKTALGVAVPDATINVATGTYPEIGQIDINKNLTIVGADKLTTIIKPTQNTGNSGDDRGWFLVNPGITFNLSNVTLDGIGKLVNIGILSHGPGTIDNNILKNLGYNPSSDYAGRGIAFYDCNMTISNNNFSNIGRIGMYCYGSGVTNGIFIGNTYTGKGEGLWLDYAIEIEGGAHATITNDTISNCKGVAYDNSTSAGILATTYFASGTQATIAGGVFTNNTDGIAVGYDESDGSAVEAHNNKFSGNTHAINSTQPVVNAILNWWGAASGPIHSTNPTGTGDAVSDNVSYNPWWSDEAMTIPLPVEMVSFTVTVNHMNADLQWSTATEVNNYGFEVERRQTTTWAKIGFVPGAGTSNAPREYSYSDNNLSPGHYVYRIKQIDNNGSFSYHYSAEVEIGSAPKTFALSQNYPNPFNPSTTISYQLPTAGLIILKVYDALGKEVIKLVNGEKPIGNYSVEFNASNLTSGIYFYRISAGNFVQTKKMVLLK